MWVFTVCVLLVQAYIFLLKLTTRGTFNTLNSKPVRNYYCKFWLRSTLISGAQKNYNKWSTYKVTRALSNPTCAVSTETFLQSTVTAAIYVLTPLPLISPISGKLWQNLFPKHSEQCWSKYNKMKVWKWLVKKEETQVTKFIYSVGVESVCRLVQAYITYSYST